MSPGLKLDSATEVDQCIHVLQKNGIKLVVFDMDLTAVRQHSRGKLSRSALEEYLSHATPAFLALVPRLYDHGFHLAIATHSDEAEFDGIDVQRETHILGTELATRLVRDCFSQEVSDAFAIVAYNPRVHPEQCNLEDYQFKRYHMRFLLSKFGVQSTQVAFFDDTATVVDDCRQYCRMPYAFQVNSDFGFRMQDVLDNLH